MRDDRMLQRLTRSGRVVAATCCVLIIGCSTTPEPDAGSAIDEELLTSSDFTAIYERANESFDQQDYRDAYLLYVRVVELDPRHVGALVNAGLSSRRLGDIDGALGWYDRALALAPNDTTALQNRLLAGMLLGHLQESVAVASRLVSLEPTVAEYRSQLGDLYLQSGNYELALQHFDRAISLDPTHSESLYKKGLAAAGLNRIDTAIEALRGAISLDPDLRAAYAPLAQALLFAEDYDSAWNVVTQGQHRGAQFDPGFMLELQEQSESVGPE